ncbi:hypothetical protein DASC09_054130 [Saccharomycopsis crataegensis]|uniref:Uncharacterized protein n=1 Tax=Saccharomycopsis crataegensis TaxID=43959 RepID=A0AAV5QT38_9ASCO|nr:hypothetical protein DASC09_054130 [Saccharomycopsis crataegensis]
MDGFIHASNPDFEFDFSDIGDFKTLNKLSLCSTYVDYSKISHLKSLEKLYIEDCFNLSRFKNVLMNLKNLRKIIIVDCKFDGFSDDIILENLEDLKLTACSLYKLGGLGGCLNLKSLMAIESKIEEVTTDLSIFLKLENLDLAENNLSTLENIHSIPNLKTLNVEENDFVAIDKPLNYPKLTELIISSNIIKVLDDKNSPLKSLEILKYQCCGLEKISVDFSKFEKLRELSLDSSMNFGTYIVSMKPFTRISSLETLNLSATDLTEIDHQLCGDRLTSLCLSDNDIAELKNLESLVHLKYLEVAHCKLTSIKMNFSCLKNLEELCLHDNNLSSFENINDIPSLIKLNYTKTTSKKSIFL